MNSITKIVSMAAISILFYTCSSNNYTHIVGYALGTTYSIKYNSKDNYQKDIEDLLLRIEQSLSIYNDSSIISRVNRNENVELDSFFIECFRLAHQVYIATNGSFDISASALFEVWGFGKTKNNTVPTQHQIDSIKNQCGMDKIYIHSGHIVKKNPSVKLNCNAIAKGYAVDVAARYINSKNIEDYIVEIGGEVACRGVNENKKVWTIGIDKPEDNNYIAGSSLQAEVQLNNRAIATSGNYRRFFEADGSKYSHTIDPISGQSVAHNLLSASIIADNCALADAYATACMVIGLDSAKNFLKRHPELDACLIYADNNDNFQVYSTIGITK